MHVEPISLDEEPLNEDYSPVIAQVGDAFLEKVFTPTGGTGINRGRY